MTPSLPFICLCAIITLCAPLSFALADDPEFAESPASATGEYASMDVLSPDEWRSVEGTVDRALAWLATQQGPNGSFHSADIGQPAVTGLCVLAFLSSGHLPGEGPYGKQLTRALEFIVSCRQQAGLLSFVPPEPSLGPYNAAHTAIYNHAISALTLTKTFGMARGNNEELIRGTIEEALHFVMERQEKQKRQQEDIGGWRYVRDWSPSESDLSVTSWQLLFLRSAKNAGFDVPAQNIDNAIQYVQRCYDPRQRAFLYGLIGPDRHTSRAMTGAGILSLSMAGLHGTEMARNAGNWILTHPFDSYLQWGVVSNDDRYFYSLFYCTQAMFHLGGYHWERFYPPTVKVLARRQSPSGSWDEEPGSDAIFQRTYSTSLVVLSLTTPYQLLPINQR